jgi:hypothetical protein
MKSGREGGFAGCALMLVLRYPHRRLTTRPLGTEHAHLWHAQTLFNTMHRCFNAIRPLGTEHAHLWHAQTLLKQCTDALMPFGRWVPSMPIYGTLRAPNQRTHVQAVPIEKAPSCHLWHQPLPGPLTPHGEAHDLIQHHFRNRRAGRRPITWGHRWSSCRSPRGGGTPACAQPMVFSSSRPTSPYG